MTGQGIWFCRWCYHHTSDRGPIDKLISCYISGIVDYYSCEITSPVCGNCNNNTRMVIVLITLPNSKVLGYQSPYHLPPFLRNGILIAKIATTEHQEREYRKVLTYFVKYGISPNSLLHLGMSAGIDFRRCMELIQEINIHIPSSSFMHTLKHHRRWMKDVVTTAVQYRLLNPLYFLRAVERYGSRDAFDWLVEGGMPVVDADKILRVGMFCGWHNRTAAHIRSLHISKHAQKRYEQRVRTGIDLSKTLHTYHELELSSWTFHWSDLHPERDRYFSNGANIFAVVQHNPDECTLITVYPSSIDLPSRSL